VSRLLVTDASVVIDLLGRFRPGPIEAVLFEAGTQLAAPELLDVEVLHTLRKLEAQRAIPSRRRATVVEDFRSLRIRRYRHAPLWDDIWKLRINLTAYDGCYVALARPSVAPSGIDTRATGRAMPDMARGYPGPAQIGHGDDRQGRWWNHRQLSGRRRGQAKMSDQSGCFS